MLKLEADGLGSHGVHTFEHVTAEGFSLDLALPKSKLAVEVDGPSHYLKDGGEYVADGATR